MLGSARTLALFGLAAQPVTVEATNSPNIFPANFVVVGLPDAVVSEARERIRAAFRAAGLDFPRGKVTVNLAPAEVKKSGAGFDLPIAAALILAGLPGRSPHFEKAAFFGELGLDGSVRHLPGVLPLAAAARDRGFSQIFVPEIDAAEARLVAGVEIFPVKNLGEVGEILSGEKSPEPAGALSVRDFLAEKNGENSGAAVDFAEIRGQEQTKRALEIAAAGGLNCLMSGAPGAGKTLMARAFSGILPAMTESEMIEVTAIHSVANLLSRDRPLVTERPFRSAHHTASAVSIVGGGTQLRPGAVTLAHRGVLFLDEFAEFPGAVLETLRQPLEDRKITISRAAGTVEYPADFMLLAAMNPCPCGYFNIPDAPKPCSCAPATVARYRKRLSGPLLDRIDLHVEVSPVKTEKLLGADVPAGVENSPAIRARVEAARARQRERFAGRGIFTNSEMGLREIKEFCRLTPDCEDFLKNATRHYGLSARGAHRVLKIARTIADLAGTAGIEFSHLSEAVQYRARVE